MISIIGTLIGLFGSLLPKLLDYLKVKEDHKHELEVLKVQAEMAKSEHLYKMEEVNAQADITSEQAVYAQATQTYSGSKFFDGLLALYSGTVRPTITYLFMAAYLVVKYAQFQVIVAQSTSVWSTIWQLWNSEDMAAFMTIIGFWFGGRLLKSNLATFGVGKNGEGNGNGKSSHSQPALEPVVTGEPKNDKPPTDVPTGSPVTPSF